MEKLNALLNQHESPTLMLAGNLDQLRESIVSAIHEINGERGKIEPETVLREKDEKILENQREERKLMKQLEEHEAKMIALKEKNQELEISAKILSTKKALVEGASEMNINSFIEYANHCTYASKVIESKLGFQMKLASVKGENSIWLLKFIFNTSEDETKKAFALVRYSLKDERFLLDEMQPRPLKFKDIKSFLEQSDDITGFLYFCGKFFKN